MQTIWNRAGKWVAYPLAAIVLFLIGYIPSIRLCRSAAYGQGYKLGLASDVRADSSAMAARESDAAHRQALRSVGIDVDKYPSGGWHIAGFYLVSASLVGWGIDDEELDTTLVPYFVVTSRAVTGRWYFVQSSDRNLHYVE